MNLELRNFKVMYLFFIVSVIVLIGSSQLVLQHQLGKHEKHNTYTNKINRQIILNKQITATISNSKLFAPSSDLNNTQENLKLLIADWKTNFHYLSDTVFQNGQILNEDISTSIQNAESNFLILKASLNQVVQNSLDAVQTAEAISSILLQEKSLSSELEHILYSYSVLVSKQVTLYKKKEFLLAFLIFFILALEILFMFRPAIKNLKSHKDAANKSSKLKEQFLSQMTHEIRTPLNGVVGITRILMEENPKPNQIQHLRNLKFSTDTLMMLINDILDFNKIEADKIELEESEFNLKEIIDGIEQTLIYKAEEKNIGLKVLFDQSIYPILIGDSTRIKQILNNLISNAIKFTEIGEVVLSVSCEWQNDKAIGLKFSVEDSGIGIPKDKVSSIFNDFVQASSNTTRKYGGTGLGLSITKSLLELMGSKIYVKSEENKGSTFYFSLSLEKGSEYSKSIQISASTTQNLLPYDVQVLLVEDNEINRLIANRLLKQWGLHIDNAENGKVALEMIKQKKYDIILMDLQMPEMDGYETTLAIRSEDLIYAKDVPIIALTAMATSKTKKKVLAHGMTDFATKPFNPEEIYNKIFKYVKQNKEKDLKQISKIESIVNELTEGDAQFKQKLSGLYVDAFQSLKDEYRSVLLQPDLKKLSSIIHKNYTTLSLLKLEELSVELQRGKALINSDNIEKPLLLESVNRVEKMCEEVLHQLNNLSEPGKPDMQS